MAITQGQTQAALATAISLKNEVDALVIFLTQVSFMASNSWTIKQNLGGIPVASTIDAATQAQLLAQYDTLKAALVTTFQQLP